MPRNASPRYDVDDSIVEYTMTSYLFGIWCAVSSASALRHNVTDMNPNPLIHWSFYVDDMLKLVIHETKRVLRNSGFNLTKYMVDLNALLEYIDIEIRTKDGKEIVL